MNKTINADYYKKRFFVEQKDLDNIVAIGEQIATEMPVVFDEFYNWLQKLPEYNEYFSSEVIERVKSSQWAHWSAFFRGQIDDAYINGRRNSGQIYASIGLPFDIYYASIVAFANLYEKAFMSLEIDSFSLLSSFYKIVNMDTAIAVDTYLGIVNQTIKQQGNALLELSTPITQLWNSILLLPLVGIIDSKRAQDIMSAMLDKISDTQSKVFILDISGISMVDTAVANYLIKITRATRLMGCYCVISGVSGAVAQTIVELGIKIDEVATTGTMKDALMVAFKRTGIELSRNEEEF